MANLKDTNIDGSLTVNDKDVNVIEEFYDGNDGWRYIKYTNGLINLYYYVTKDTISINSAYGNFYQGTKVINFPFKLQKIFHAGIGLCQTGTGATWGVIRAMNTSYFEVRIFDIVSRSGANSYTDWSAYFAGLWK